jgi:pimeloyl-ACP methyl ester carboxylesterase
LGAGIDGWVDETLAILGDWPDIRLPAVTTSLVWYHAHDDRNVPLSAARRLVDALPNATLVVWPDRGHFAAYRREGQVLDELLTR